MQVLDGSSRSFQFAFCVLASAVAATAQCGLQLLPGSPLPGLSAALGEQVLATAEWDPDGAGPAPAIEVIGGHFAAAGTVRADNIAAYDRATGRWQAFGGGFDDDVLALAVLPTGELVAAGRFTRSGQRALGHVARWTGSQWLPLGPGLDGAVGALAILSNGDLVAGGSFAAAGPTPVANVARWNGLQWSALGVGINGSVAALVEHPTGDVIAAGRFAQAGGIAVANIARWNGSGWSAVGPGLDDSVLSLAALSNGDIVAGGFFGSSGGTQVGMLARFDGVAWQAMGRPNSGVDAILARRNGEIVVGGRFTQIGGVNARYTALFDGTTWSALGVGPDSQATCLGEIANGEIACGGRFTGFAGVRARGYASFDGANWHGTTSGFDAAPSVLLALPDDGLLAAGPFLSTPDGLQPRLAVRRNGSWQPIPDLVGQISAVVQLPNGDLVVGGIITSAGGLQVQNVARWNGQTWSRMGTGLNGQVRAMTVLANGDVVAVGPFQQAGTLVVDGVARWTGTAWLPLGAGLQFGLSAPQPLAVTAMPNGDVVVAGVFTRSGTVALNNVGRFDGVAWQPMGLGLTGAAQSLLALPNGDVLAGGTLAGTMGVARWDGVAWSRFAPGLAATGARVAVLPDGDVVVGGMVDVVGGALAPGLVRFDGTSWSQLLSCNDLVTDVCVLPRGSIAVAGRFSLVDGLVAASLAELTTTCGAASIAYGAGCAGGGGVVQLTSNDRAWTGGTFAADASGFGASAVAIPVLGLAQAAVPLSTLHPLAAPGCTLLLRIDQVLGLQLPAAGAVRVSLSVPDSVALAGLVFDLQVLQAEFTGAALVRVTSSNGLGVLVGSF